MYFCVALSTRQLWFDIFDPVRIAAVFPIAGTPLRGNVSLDNVIGRYYPEDTCLTL